MGVRVRGEKCLQLPRDFSSERRSSRCTEETRVGVMVMQRLMEMSCRDPVLVCQVQLPSRNVDRGRCDSTGAGAPVSANKQNNSFFNKGKEGLRV